MTSKTPAYTALPNQLRLFVQGIAAGMNQTEAAHHAGCRAKNLKMQGSRWARMPGVREAIAELREERREGEDQLWRDTLEAIQDLIADKTSPIARAHACATVAKLQGRLAPTSLPVPPVPKISAANRLGEARRLTRIVLRAMPVEDRTEFLREVLADDLAGLLPEIDGAGAQRVAGSPCSSSSRRSGSCEGRP